MLVDKPWNEYVQCKYFSLEKCCMKGYIINLKQFLSNFCSALCTHSCRCDDLNETEKNCKDFVQHLIIQMQKMPKAQRVLICTVKSFILILLGPQFYEELGYIPQPTPYFLCEIVAITCKQIIMGQGQGHFRFFTAEM